jgi:Helicase HerA, central domain
MSWWQLQSIPRRSPDENANSEQLVAALMSAHGRLEFPEDEAGRPGELAVCWLRSPRSTRFQILLGGSPKFPLVETADLPSMPHDNVPALYPPGSLARHVLTADVVRQLVEMPAWLRCPGQTDTLASALNDGRRTHRSTFDECVAHLSGAFAWMVVARPAPDAQLAEELDALLVQISLARRRDNSERHRLDLENLEIRFREMTKARRVGGWSVEILVGAAEQRRCQAVASVLCHGADLGSLPYRIAPGRHVTSLAEIPDVKQRDEAFETPFLATTEMLATVARPPTSELPGIRTLRAPDFDVTPEVPSDGAQVQIGQILDRALRPIEALRIPTSTLNRHTFICGATGSGKSQTCRALLESLARLEPPVPWLVVESAKAEYAGMAGRLGSPSAVIRITPGDLHSPPASLNPLEPEPGFPLQSHVDLVRSLFLAAFEAHEPFPQVVAQALNSCYAEAGWDLVDGSQRPAPTRHDGPWGSATDVRERFPTMSELQTAARRIVESIGYGPEITADVRGFIDVRIGSLRTGTPGRFFEGGHPLDIGGMLARNVVLELENITNDQDKAFLIGAVLIRVVEHLRVLQAKGQGPPLGELRHVLVVEEAHRLLKKAVDGPSAAAVELFASLLAEIRAYGEGVVIVEQIPAKIVPDVIKNTALKIMHRLPAHDDRSAVGATMNLRDEQSESVVSFRTGLAAVSVDGADYPFLVQMEDGSGREDNHCGTTPPLRGSRSHWCSVRCHERPCALSMINEASHLAGHPGVVLHVEAVTAALAMGLSPPVARQEVQQVWNVPADLKACALATATDRAVDARRSQLRRWVDPDGFGQQLHATLENQLGGGTGELADPRRWAAGYYRFLPEWLWLEAEVDARGESARDEPAHPDTALWAAAGLRLNGRTLLDQLDEIGRHPAFAESEKRVATGDPNTSGLRDAILTVTGAATTEAAERAFLYYCAGPTLATVIAMMNASVDW